MVKKGDRIKLLQMNEDPDPIPVGTEGIVTYVSKCGDFTQIAVDWDNGRKLMLAVPPDEFVKI